MARERARALGSTQRLLVPGPRVSRARLDSWGPSGPPLLHRETGGWTPLPASGRCPRLSRAGATGILARQRHPGPGGPRAFPRSHLKAQLAGSITAGFTQGGPLNPCPISRWHKQEAPLGSLETRTFGGAGSPVGAPRCPGVAGWRLSAIAGALPTLGAVGEGGGGQSLRFFGSRPWVKPTEWQLVIKITAGSPRLTQGGSGPRNVASGEEFTWREPA